MTNRHSIAKALHIALLPAIGAALLIPAITHDAPKGDYIADTQAEYDSTYARYGTLHPTAILPEGCTATPHLTDHLMVLHDDYGTDALPMTYDQVTNAPKGTLWVVGFC